MYQREVQLQPHLLSSSEAAEIQMAARSRAGATITPEEMKMLNMRNAAIAAIASATLSLLAMSEYRNAVMDQCRYDTV